MLEWKDETEHGIRTEPWLYDCVEWHDGGWSAYHYPNALNLSVRLGKHPTREEAKAACERHANTHAAAPTRHATPSERPERSTDTQ